MFLNIKYKDALNLNIYLKYTTYSDNSIDKG